MSFSVTRYIPVAVAALAMSACGSSPGPEAELEAWVDAMQTAAEEKDRREIVRRISSAYGDARGNSREDVENRLRLLFLQQGRIAVLPKIDDIRIIGEDAAEMALTVGMAGTDSGRLGLSADAYRFELELVSEDGDWQLISARWGELGSPVM